MKRIDKLKNDEIKKLYDDIKILKNNKIEFNELIEHKKGHAIDQVDRMNEIINQNKTLWKKVYAIFEIDNTKYISYKATDKFERNIFKLVEKDLI